MSNFGILEINQCVDAMRSTIKIKTIPTPTAPTKGGLNWSLLMSETWLQKYAAPMSTELLKTRQCINRRCIHGTLHHYISSKNLHIGMFHSGVHVKIHKLVSVYKVYLYNKSSTIELRRL